MEYAFSREDVKKPLIDEVMVPRSVRCSYRSGNLACITPLRHRIRVVLKDEREMSYDLCESHGGGLLEGLKAAVDAETYKRILAILSY
ncbi:MAG: hypothetical protein HYW25_01945 [Candidatus Aenigmarchaeota archaeon]|nr:hypothetical protein [Candidatus Aenigmarchaeota archaeon]